MTQAHASLPDLIKTDGRVRHPAKRVFFGIGAVVCLALGLVLGPMPVAPGIPFFIASIVCVGMASERAAKWINERERRLAPRWRVRLRKMIGRGKETGADDAKSASK
jgi:hypothetical protein